ncbi:MAG: MFS transporter [Pseudomonadota bacterium]
MALTSATQWMEDTNRRNVAFLALAQAFFMCVQTMGIATTPLAAHAMLGVDKTLATLPIVLVHVGLMVGTIPASLLMARIGRRNGFTLGALFGIACGVISVAAIYQQSFWLLCFGAFLQGISGAFAWYYRLAAADGVEGPFKAKAIALVMAGGVVAGVLGPQTAKWTVDWFAPVMFVGVYVMVAVYSAAMLLAVQGVRIPRLTPEERRHGGRPLSEIAKQPAYVVALMSSMFGYAVMTLVMSATPLAMLACGFSFSDSATVIQAHVIAMFLPSFFTGHLIARFGVHNIIIVGAVLELACALINLSGIAFAHFLIANILVGLGWNFCYVGGSTLLTRTYTPAERAKVQASHDFAVYASTALAALLSGVLHAQAGWTVVNAAAVPLMTVVALAGLWFARHGRKGQPAIIE